MSFSPTKRRFLGGTARDKKSIGVEYAEKSLLLSVPAALTEQIRAFHVGESLECAGFRAPVSVRNREEPLL